MVGCACLLVCVCGEGGERGRGWQGESVGKVVVGGKGM